jgi:hypothetical protein
VIAEQIVGAWELISYIEQDHPDEPARYPHGREPQGLILYTPDGYMSAQIMTPGRPNYDRAVAAGGTSAQTAAAATGYLAYSGPYYVDESSGDIHHDVAVCLMPNWLGQTQLRHSQLHNGHLTLSAEATLNGGQTLLSTLLWKRAPARKIPAGFNR